MDTSETSETGSTRSPSRLCADDEDFTTWLESVGLSLKLEFHGAPHEEVVYPIQLAVPLNESAAPPEDPMRESNVHSVAQCLQALRALCQVAAQPDGAPNLYNVEPNVRLLIKTFTEFSGAGADPEACLRYPVDRLLTEVFEDCMRQRHELLISLPDIDETTREDLRLTPNSHAKIAATLYKVAAFNTVSVDAKAAKTNASLAMLPSFCAKFPNVAIPDFFVEYQTEKELNVKNQVMLDMGIALVHRRHLNLMHRPVHGMAIFKDRFYYFFGEWINDEPVITKFSTLCPLTRFEHWFTLYLTLIKIRDKIQAIPLPDINLLHVMPKDTWFPAPVRGRTRKSSTRGHPPAKRLKLDGMAPPDPPAEGDASQLAGEAGEDQDSSYSPGGTDDESWCDSESTISQSHGMPGAHDESLVGAEILAPQPVRKVLRPFFEALLGAADSSG